MASLGLQNVAALLQERVLSTAKFIGENEAPFFKYIMSLKKGRITEEGMRIPFQTAEDGGDTYFTYADSSFRPYIPAEYDAMRVYPARFAKSLQFTGEMLRILRNGLATEGQVGSMAAKTEESAKSSRKILNRHFHGDGTGTLSISQSAIGATGVATLAGMYITSGTSAHTSTKGTSWLKKNEIYQAINPATDAVRGVFTVLTPGKRTCSINVTSGTIASGDLIVLFSSYKKVPVGIRLLANFNNRVMQNFNTANAADMNTPVIDNGGNPISPAAFSAAKTLVQVFNNDAMQDRGRLIIMTPGHNSTLVNQAFQYRSYTNPRGNETVYGVPSKYVDADGDIHFLDADAPDDQIRILDANSYHVAESMPWGVYDDDGQEFRMLFGTYNAGSDEWMKAIGWQGQLYKDGRALSDVVITNIAHSGADYVTQTYI